MPESTAPVPLRVVTVKQPYASLIVRGRKDVENRVRNIAGQCRGPVAIHAGLGHVPEPIAYTGALGLRRLDDATTARAWEAIA
ncbi:ASCH domain-containing protein [Microbacterium aurantiacum]|uniref:ASCH domain-containing protein n=1 Tax=Microbacterium aurantiacum TaxID=162393 RepID=A0ABT8FRH2_9MICO|nr:ASCH domain-containing protein [Microbacterium aurantiacum]MDN4463916.1 ASCH domain-containing protein [Microbacterium aurantiacum]